MGNHIVAISHVGLCVSDLGRSLRFYCEGLGFEPGARFEVGSEFGPTLEVAGDVAVTSQFVARDGCSIELLHYARPEVQGRPAAARNQLGFTHLCVRVDDIERSRPGWSNTAEPCWTRLATRSPSARGARTTSCSSPTRTVCASN